jgi:hypothetical protein
LLTSWENSSQRALGFPELEPDIVTGNDADHVIDLYGSDLT